MKTAKEVDLGREPVGRLFAMLAIPAIASQVVNALYNIVDRMYIGHIADVGATALTGVGVCFPLIMIISAFASLMAMGGAPRASIFLGQGEQNKAEQIMGNCFTALVITAVVLTALVLAFQTPLLYLFGASDNTIGYAGHYMTIYAIGKISVQLTLGMNAFVSTQGFSKISMLTVIIGAITNIVLDPIFIFVFDMGVKGAAWATIISQTVSAIWVVKFLLGKQTTLRLKKQYLAISLPVLMPAIALGVAPFVMQSTESLLVLCFNSSLLKYGGDLAVGAMTILSSVMQFAMLPLQGFTQGAQPIISFNYGARNKDRLKKAVKISLLSCLAYSILLWLLVMEAPHMYSAMVTNDVKLMEITVWALRIYMFGLLLFGAQIACQQAFIALGNAKVSAFLAIFRKIIVLIPLIYILPMFIEDQVFAIFLAEPIADTIAVLTTTTMFIISFKKLLKRMDETNQVRDGLKSV